MSAESQQQGYHKEIQCVAVEGHAGREEVAMQVWKALAIDCIPTDYIISRKARVKWSRFFD